MYEFEKPRLSVCVCDALSSFMNTQAAIEHIVCGAPCVWMKTHTLWLSLWIQWDSLMLKPLRLHEQSRSLIHDRVKLQTEREQKSLPLEELSRVDLACLHHRIKKRKS